MLQVLSTVEAVPATLIPNFTVTESPGSGPGHVLVTVLDVLDTHGEPGNLQDTVTVLNEQGWFGSLSNKLNIWALLHYASNGGKKPSKLHFTSLQSLVLPMSI